VAVKGSDIVARARREIGDRYVWGAEGPNAFDCSGLVQYVFNSFGIRPPRVAADQARYGQAVTRAQLQPGDLIFFNYDGGKIDHVGIYSGDGKMIHAPNSNERVKESTIGWSSVAAMRRFPGVERGPATSEEPGGRGPLGINLPNIPGVPDPDSIVGVMKGIAEEIKGIGAGIASVGKVADLLVSAFLPNNIIRGVAGFAGAIFCLIGIWFLSREVRAS
jgi:hypothetical protein